MAYETFELRFEGCNHTMKIPLLHNQDELGISYTNLRKRFAGECSVLSFP